MKKLFFISIILLNFYCSGDSDYDINELGLDDNVIIFVSNFGSSGKGDGQFQSPSGIVITGTNIYVADKNNNRIQKFGLEGNFITKWGSYGSGDGQFLKPEDLAIDKNGYVYVADTGHSRIQKFDADGNFVAKWGSWSTSAGPGQFQTPSAIAADSMANIYVVDRYTARVQKFDADGNYLTEWSFHDSGDGASYQPLNFILDIVIDSSDNVYITYPGTNKIKKFDSNGTFIMNIGYHTDPHPDYRETLPYYIYSPSGITINSEGNILVTTALSDGNGPGVSKIVKYDTNGNFILKWGDVSTEISSVGYIYCWPSPCYGPIATDSNKYIYVKSGDSFCRFAYYSALKN